MSHRTTNLVHIADIKPGDTVMHEGREMTVCADNLKRDPFMGRLLFGDCYRLGLKKVERIEFKRVLGYPK